MQKDAPGAPGWRGFAKASGGGRERQRAWCSDGLQTRSHHASVSLHSELESACPTPAATAHSVEGTFRQLLCLEDVKTGCCVSHPPPHPPPPLALMRQNQKRAVRCEQSQGVGPKGRVCPVQSGVCSNSSCAHRRIITEFIARTPGSQSGCGLMELSPPAQAASTHP